jgi:phosphomannomutase
MQFSIGGQISFDCFPVGWDKTFCLRHLQKHDFRFIHFYGDKSEEVLVYSFFLNKTFYVSREEQGGNDHELFCSKKTIGHAVTSPEHTAALVEKQFGPL